MQNEQTNSGNIEHSNTRGAALLMRWLIRECVVHRRNILVRSTKPLAPNSAS